MKIFNFLKRNFFGKKKPKITNPETTSYNYHQLTNDEGKTMNDVALQQHKTILEKVMSRAKADAKSSPCLPYKDISTPSGFENELRTIYQSMIFQSRGICDATLSFLKKTWARLTAEYNNFIENKDEFIKSYSRKNNSKHSNEKEKDQRILEDKRNVLNRKIDRCLAIMENLIKSTFGLEDQLSQDHETYINNRREIILIILLVIIGILEIPMNYLLLSLWRENVIGTILLTLLFSIIIPVSAHSFGGYLKKKNNTRQEIFWMISSALVAISISAIVGTVRYHHLASKGVDILSIWGYGILNLILWVIASWLSYHFAYKNPEAIKALKIDKEKLAAEEKTLTKLKEELYALEEQAASKQHDVIDRFDDTAHLDYEKHCSSKLAEIKEKEQEYNSSLIAVKSLEETINNYYLESVHLYRSVNEKWRNDNSRPAYWNNKIEPLECFYIQQAEINMTGEGFSPNFLNTNNLQTS